jgi:hypothetical protein
LALWQLLDPLDFFSEEAEVHGKPLDSGSKSRVLIT